MVVMAGIEVRKLEHPTEDQLDRCAECLAAAFANDEFTLSAVGGDGSLILPLERAIVACTAIAGEVWVACLNDGDFATVAVWFPPGRDLLDSPDQAEAGFNQLFARLPIKLSVWWKEYFLPRYEADAIKALGGGVKRDAWNLQLLGTRPEYQRKGFAKAVLSPIIQKAKEESQLLVLETQSGRNVPVYETMGWKLVFQAETYTAIATEGFGMWVMVANEERAEV